MTTIAELISRRITPEEKSDYDGQIIVLDSLTRGNCDKEWSDFEYQVFSFLLENKRELGLKSVMQFKNLVMDGAIELSNGRCLAMEFKFRMNWEKACQAEWQFRTYLKRKDRTPFLPVQGGLVFFEEFSGDWERIAKTKRVLENGWSHWYRGHSEVEGHRLDLLRLRKGSLDHFPLTDANALVAMINKLKDEDKDHVVSRLTTGDGSCSVMRTA